MIQVLPSEKNSASAQSPALPATAGKEMSADDLPAPPVANLEPITRCPNCNPPKAAPEKCPVCGFMPTAEARPKAA